MISCACPNCHAEVMVPNERETYAHQIKNPPEWLKCPHCGTALRLVFNEAIDEEKLKELPYGWLEKVAESSGT